MFKAIQAAQIKSGLKGRYPPHPAQSSCPDRSPPRTAGAGGIGSFIAMAATNIQPLCPVVCRLSLAQRAPAVLHLYHRKPAVRLVVAGVTVVGVWVVVVVQVFGGLVINHVSSSALRYSPPGILPNRKPRV